MDRLACVDAEARREGEAPLPQDLPRLLGRFSPAVEPLREAPGTCWLDPRGVVPLWPSLPAWAGAIHRELAGAGLAAGVVVGFTRLGTLALARTGRGVRVLGSPEEERAAARKVSLARLPLPPAALEQLERLGIRTVGDLLALPPGGVLERWGPELHRLRRLAGGELEVPLSPLPPPRAFRRELHLEPPEADAGRLLLRVEELLGPLLRELAAAGRAAAGLELVLRDDRGGERRHLLKLARPGLHPGRLLELVRLRLAAEPPGVPVAGLVLELLPAPVEAEQPSLFAVARGRDLAAAERALDRVRAELGEAAVVRARLANGHLPEASFLWVPLRRLRPARPAEEGARVLVRRLLASPAPLPAFPRLPRPGRGPWLPGAGAGPVTLLAGPYVLSGGWWDRAFHREYGWALTPRGDLLWVFRDRTSRRFHLAGRVE